MAASSSRTCSFRDPLRDQRSWTRSGGRTRAPPSARPPRGRTNGWRLRAPSCGARRTLARPHVRLPHRVLTAAGGVVCRLCASGAATARPWRPRAGASDPHRVAGDSLFPTSSRRRGAEARDRPVGLLLVGAGQPPRQGVWGERGSHRDSRESARCARTDDRAALTRMCRVSRGRRVCTKVYSPMTRIAKRTRWEP